MKLGSKLKLLRGNMTQAELARHSGIDKAIISKIESGKMPGTVACHRKLAEVFGLKLSELYAYLENEKPKLIEIHPGNAKTDIYQNFLEILTTIPLTKKMLPTFISLQPKEAKFLEETNKKVERFIIVLEGEIEVALDGKVHYLRKDINCEQGDSVYSLSSKRHKVTNIGTMVARVLCVSSPPVL